METQQVNVTSNVSNVNLSGLLNFGAKPNVTKATLTNRHRRFGYNPILRNFRLHGNHAWLTGSGQDIPIGIKAYNVVTIPDFNPSLNTEEKYEPVIFRDLLPPESLGNVLRESMGMGGVDRGARELTDLAVFDDEDASRIYLAVHPFFATKEDYVKLSEVERQYSVINECPNGLTVSCATCRLKHLESFDTLSRINELPEHQQDAAMRTLQTLIESNRAAITYAASEWANIVSEWKQHLSDPNKPGISVLKDSHYWLMDNVHEMKPEMEQIVIAKQMAEAQTDAMAKAVTELVTRQDERFEKLLAVVTENKTARPSDDVQAQIAELIEENRKTKAQLEELSNLRSVVPEPIVPQASGSKKSKQVEDK